MNCNEEVDSRDDVPLKTRCFTPAVTPSTSYYEDDDDSSTSQNVASYDVYTEEPMSPASACSKSSSSAINTPCFTITVKHPSPVSDCPPATPIVAASSSPVEHPSRCITMTTITNEDDAVEVTLNHCSSQIEDHLPSPQSYRTSLFDKQEQLHIMNNFAADAFHTSPQTPVRLNFCGMQDWCDPKSTAEPPSITRNYCGAVENQCCFREDDYTQQRAVEGRIWQSLGEGLCNPWQMTYPTDISPKKCYSDREAVHQRTMKRRAFDLAARRTRLATLRRNLNPFHATAPPQRYPLSKSHSFNLSSRPTREQTTMKNQKLTSVWECGTLDCTEPKSDSPATIRFQWEEECHGYDSDPEDYPKENITAALVSQSVASDNIAGFMNARFTLIQHCNDTSVAVQAWIERGQKLHDRTILPKLVWKRLNSNHKTIVYQGFELSSIDLLDICRILPVERLDRNKWPFAVKSRAFCIRTVQQEPIIFEAQSKDARDQFMHNLKHIISRLAAKILTRDPSASEEFFAEESHQQHFLPRRLEAWV